MLAIDANVIVLLLTDDHAEQSEKARALIARGKVFVATTVLLETEWVLRYSYRYRAADVLDSLTAFIGLPNVVLEDSALAASALGGMGAGMDFADALHLASAARCDAFVSFDTRLAKAARGLGGLEVRAP
ncbi:MAG: type II toxin-antitoxin system VapC family toxin [Pseudomonadota bacterium]|nr:type II toxin-antitoxin system VapC family toxin [Pseudomonadota bacterium]